jgi:PPOX class probable F420-dependent enzyme
MRRMPEPTAAPATIPPHLLDLLEGQALAHLATVRADGTPQVTPVWIDHDGQDLLVNSRLDRVKARHMQERPAVAVSVADPENPYRYLCVRGEVVGWTEDGWREHMDRLARRYQRIAKYPWSFPGERRAIFRIRPRHVFYEDGDAEIPDWPL